MRTDKPIGTLLLLWPTLWGLLLASGGSPSVKNLIIFCFGCWLMRSAGCVINDFADRKIDGGVKRTQGRPLVTGAVLSKEALALFAALCIAAFILVLQTNTLTIMLSVAAVALAATYPLMKRYTHLPQVVLGAAFSWSIPMAFSAETNSLPAALWLLYAANVVWTVTYDTFYAMVDRDDDVKIGVKSTAILFGRYDRLITAVLQIIVIALLIASGIVFELGAVYYTSLAVISALFVYQQILIKNRDGEQCFNAFLHNNYVGMAICIGIALDLWLT
ncbi:MAG: 4-hydroxybenzoate octaprenyltransferase [Sinobacterium sp.]|jgi:4-hydroxybenzoate polyprenyltransferase